MFLYLVAFSYMTIDDRLTLTLTHTVTQMSLFKLLQESVPKYIILSHLYAHYHRDTHPEEEESKKKKTQRYN